MTDSLEPDRAQAIALRLSFRIRGSGCDAGRRGGHADQEKVGTAANAAKRQLVWRAGRRIEWRQFRKQ